jgi:hypothetical protein
MLKLAELAVIVGLTMLVNVAVPVLVSVNPNTGANSGFVPRVTVPKLCEDGVRFAPGCVLTPPHCVPADTSTAPTSTQGLAAVFRGLPKKSVAGAWRRNVAIHHPDVHDLPGIHVTIDTRRLAGTAA